MIPVSHEKLEKRKNRILSEDDVKDKNFGILEHEDRLNEIDVNIRVNEIIEMKSKNHDNDSSNNDVHYFNN